MYDSELSGASGNTGRSDNLSKAQRTANCVAFCKRIEQLGYKGVARMHLLVGLRAI